MREKKCDRMLRELREKLGDKYRITHIDLERVLYRDFGNGFDVEISEVDTTNPKKKAVIYLWFEKNLIVEHFRNIPRGSIGDKVEELYRFTQKLIADGDNNYEALFHRKYPELRREGCK